MKTLTQPFQGCITFRNRDLYFKAEILPARKAPHVGADSPRHLEPGRPASVHTYRLFDAEDDTGYECTSLYWHYREKIKELILFAWWAEQTVEAAR